MVKCDFCRREVSEMSSRIRHLKPDLQESSEPPTLHHLADRPPKILSTVDFFYLLDCLTITGLDRTCHAHHFCRPSEMRLLYFSTVGFFYFIFFLSVAFPARPYIRLPQPVPISKGRRGGCYFKYDPFENSSHVGR